MRYFGSKASTAVEVEAQAARLFGNASLGATMCDPFGGIGIIASSFKRNGWRVTIGDHLLFPHYYQLARLSKSSFPPFIKLKLYLDIDSTNVLETYIKEIPASTGWITKEYSIQRQFFTSSNARKIDAVWKSIRRWREDRLINNQEYILLISSLIDSFDKVANTAGTYYAYLKSTTRRALNDFNFQLLPPVKGPFAAVCKRDEAINTVAGGRFDVLYLDPPYSSRSYDRYYHLPQTVASGSQSIPVGISGVPSDPPIRSKFESPLTAEKALVDLVEAANCSVLMLQYAEGGLISLDRIRKILSSRGKVREIRIETIGYTTQKKARMNHHSLFIVTDV